MGLNRETKDQVIRRASLFLAMHEWVTEGSSTCRGVIATGKVRAVQHRNRPAVRRRVRWLPT